MSTEANWSQMSGANGGREGRKRRTRDHAGRGRRRALEMSGEPPIGAHVLTPRRGYIHHGIYVGHGKVVHYRGLSGAFCSGPVEEVPLAQFALGRPVWIGVRRASVAGPEEVVRRARLRIGENRYRIFTNNCEHFCEWCLSGDPRSYQVEAVVGRFLVWLKRLAAMVSPASPTKVSTDTFA